MDLQHLKEELTGLIDKSKDASKKDIKSSEAEMRTQITAMSTTTIENATEGDRKTLKESEIYTDNAIGRVSKTLADRVDEGERKTRKLEESFRQELKSAMDSLKVSITTGIAEMHAELSALTNNKAAEALEA